MGLQAKYLATTGAKWPWYFRLLETLQMYSHYIHVLVKLLANKPRVPTGLEKLGKVGKIEICFPCCEKLGKLEKSHAKLGKVGKLEKAGVV